jgi:hypothetical protein
MQECYYDQIRKSTSAIVKQHKKTEGDGGKIGRRTAAEIAGCRRSNDASDARGESIARTGIPDGNGGVASGVYRELFFDLNIRRFHEKLQEAHKIDIVAEWRNPGVTTAQQ